MQFLPSTWGYLWRRRQRRRAQGPLQPGRRDLRRRQLPPCRRWQPRPLQGDPRLQPRQLVRAGGARHRAGLRQAARKPGRLADRPHRGRPLPGRRRRPLRRRSLHPRDAEAGHPGRPEPLRQRGRDDLVLPHPPRHRHLLPPGSAGRRRQRRRDQGGGSLPQDWAASSSWKTHTATATPTPSWGRSSAPAGACSLPTEPGSRSSTPRTCAPASSRCRPGSASPGGRGSPPGSSARARRWRSAPT